MNGISVFWSYFIRYAARVYLGCAGIFFIVLPNLFVFGYSADWVICLLLGIGACASAFSSSELAGGFNARNIIIVGSCIVGIIASTLAAFLFFPVHILFGLIIFAFLIRLHDVMVGAPPWPEVSGNAPVGGRRNRLVFGLAFLAVAVPLFFQAPHIRDMSLIWAADEGHAEFLHWLIALDADLNAQERNRGDTALMMAVKNEHIGEVKTLISVGANIEMSNRYGHTALTSAVGGPSEITRMLLAMGASVSIRKTDGSTPLHLAARMESAQIVGMILDRGADVEARNKLGYTPLHLAVLRGCAEVVGTSIEEKRAADSRYDAEKTPSHRSTSYVREDMSGVCTSVVGLLVEAGANVNAPDKDGRTPLDISLENEHHELSRYLESVGGHIGEEQRIDPT